MLLGEASLDEEITYKFEETIKDENENEKTITVDLKFEEAIDKILEAIPASQRANYSEETSSSKTKFTDEEMEEAM